LTDKERKQTTLIATFITLPFVLAVPPIMGWWIGTWLDEQFGTTPWLMYSMLVAGIVAGIREFYRIVKKYGNDGSGQ